MLALEITCASCMRIVATLAGTYGAVISCLTRYRYGRFHLLDPAHRPPRQQDHDLTAANDRALALSRRLAGGVARVGAAEKARLEKLGLRVIDASEKGWGLINHRPVPDQ